MMSERIADLVSREYFFVNDVELKPGSDLAHQIWLLTINDRLGIAPPCDKGSIVGRVLDIGTGSGIWAIDFGDEHPEAEVLGNDLSVVQPSLVPPNVRFEIDDVEDEWTHSQPFQHLEPGGYLELQETSIIPRSDDDTLKPQHAVLKWSNLLLEASLKLGRPYMDVPVLKQYMTEAGFEDVTMHVYKWPSNDWPKDPRYKELGMWNQEQTLMGLEAFSMAPLTRALDWTPAEVNTFLIDVRKDLKDRAIHAYWPE
ncbi:Secondary metabolism regulator LAE1 [Colletotrichum sp. SAR 10_70]|nr:Secondary metabolism regulator LAE1 [Colletotrichum sp. SAR 10_71]KAI8192353.1 Secondary metabolism regulator LAE1 [Colletotrichum sp. SAR 10_75]KAI8199098.1 Secondary metabolism regulator LAE1 [Colletotrichum sp. SAR 10_70]KAI8213957.1 Secondary metabolism regulator LAE1 [Colletotrichum sp. SAR 10_76]KAI8253933.1 Secondary metabolism regulator LAE1 [Colletotrichum sp. SAR 10_77]KAJ5007323.1 Secondary metabolism regulator LAE1 [Colletotrichum sp. SAR 10_66]